MKLFNINKDKRCDHKTTKGNPTYAVIFDQHPQKLEASSPKFNFPNIC